MKKILLAIVLTLSTSLASAECIEGLAIEDAQDDYKGSVLVTLTDGSIYRVMEYEVYNLYAGSFFWSRNLTVCDEDRIINYDYTGSYGDYVEPMQIQTLNVKRAN